jgi:hypothetical protein
MARKHNMMKKTVGEANMHAMKKTTIVSNNSKLLGLQ